MFKPGQHIPAGTMVSITSWENDGDDYRTEVLYNFPKEHLNDLLHVLQWFSAVENDMGNDENSPEVLAERLLTAYHEGLISREFIEANFKLPALPRPGCLNSEFDDFLDNAPSDLYDDFYKFLSYPVQYDYGFTRCVSSVQLVEIEEDIIIPVLPEAHKKFIGEHCVYNVDAKMWDTNKNRDPWKV